MGRWLAPLAGLAAGFGLAALFGDQIGSLLMGVLIVLAVIVGIGFLMRMFAGRRNPAAQPAFQGAGASYRTASAAGDRTITAPRIGGAAPAATPSRFPAGFDAAGFVAAAKRNFVALQEANERGDIESLREMTTPEMFEAIKHEIAAAGGVQTQVVTLTADLLEVVTEGHLHWASVKFAGAMRDGANGPAVPFEEIWNLQKPVDGSSGWLLAGIQQVSA